MFRNQKVTFSSRKAILNLILASGLWCKYDCLTNGFCKVKSVPSYFEVNLKRLFPKILIAQNIFSYNLECSMLVQSQMGRCGQKWRWDLFPFEVSLVLDLFFHSSITNMKDLRCVGSYKNGECHKGVPSKCRDCHEVKKISTLYISRIGDLPENFFPMKNNHF